MRKTGGANDASNPAPSDVGKGDHTVLLNVTWEVSMELPCTRVSYRRAALVATLEAVR